jgi:acyl carrier protein
MHPTIAKSEPAIAIAAENSHVASLGSRVEGLDYQRIALELDTAAKIEQSIKDRRITGKVATRIIVRPPETETERKLAAIWCDLLAIEAAGTDEDFFDLGGHSLLAVQLLSRIERDLGLELPDRVIYAERLTVANLARTIELAELGIEHHEDYAAALAEIEALTDAEVEALLAQEEAGQRRA